MKYQLTETQTYDITELQTALTEAGIVASVSGHGDKSFTVHGDDTSINIIVQNHINAMTPTQREQMNVNAEYNTQVNAKLREIDIASIRSIREYIAAQPDAPQWIKDREVEATTTRSTRR